MITLFCRGVSAPAAPACPDGLAVHRTPLECPCVRTSCVLCRNRVCVARHLRTFFSYHPTNPRGHAYCTVLYYGIYLTVLKDVSHVFYFIFPLV